jgi:hypothetical protein
LSEDASFEISSDHLTDIFHQIANVAVDPKLSQQWLDSPSKLDWNQLIDHVSNQPIKIGGFTLVNPRSNLLTYEQQIRATGVNTPTLGQDLAKAGLHNLKDLDENRLRQGLATTQQAFAGGFDPSVTALTDAGSDLSLIGKACGAAIGLTVAKAIGTVLGCIFLPPSCAIGIAGTGAGAMFTGVECEADKQKKDQQKNSSTTKSKDAGDKGEDSQQSSGDANAQPSTSGSP